jgi:hypothetical protein
VSRTRRRAGPVPNGRRAGWETTRPEGWVITVPESWYEFDIRPATRDGAIADVVGARVREVPQLAPHRAELVRVLRRLARQAWESGALYCGAMAEGLGRDAAPLTASVTVSVKSAPSDGGQANTDPSFIASMLDPKNARDDTDTWCEVEVVALSGAGRAARARGVEDVELPGAPRPVRIVTMQTIVPVPGTDQVALVSCGSPLHGMATEFLDLFDAITSTFRFVTDMASPTAADGGEPPSPQSPDSI